MAPQAESGMPGCGIPGGSQHSYVASRNSSWVVYGCLEGYRYHSGDLMRQCLNFSWTGDIPTCTVDSILPKAYLVLLIIGATLSVFVACIPFDFYRFRRRKKAARKHQERLSLMTRIAPGHAKMMTETLPVDAALPAGQRRFGFRSLIKAFRYGRTLRFMAEKMKATNEDEADAGTSTGTGEATATTTTTTIATSTTTTTADNNGGLVSGTGSGSPLPPTSPNPTGNLAARARMSAVLQLWSGRGSMASRAKSLDFSDEHLTRHQLRHKRNSLVTASSSAIQAAATTAATAAAAATASCGSYEDPQSLSLDTASSFSGDAMDGGRHPAQLAPSASVDNPVLDPASPVSIRLPHIGSARYVQLAASIPEDTDEAEDGACTGGKFKITARKKVTSANSLPCSWTHPPGNPPHAVPLTPDRPGHRSDDMMAAGKVKDNAPADSGRDRAGRASSRNSIDSKPAGVSLDSLLVPSRPRPLQRQLSQDMDRQSDTRLAAGDSDPSLHEPIIADIH